MRFSVRISPAEEVGIKLKSIDTEGKHLQSDEMPAGWRTDATIVTWQEANIPMEGALKTSKVSNQAGEVACSVSVSPCKHQDPCTNCTL